ncbi:RHS repeat-associated core domain-containing protein [Burkholderia sp. PAMC 26561]|uniref:RHS repeat-associated core domain-containing protein n=1 Tax=Burkholderia sp. PAMC 26561 TaxID=1795043 RepID=UPI0013C46F13|nr:RHS repeat-associated core domain-containing protein [Burkholderia sp. PAMC 26561]
MNKKHMVSGVLRVVKHKRAYIFNMSRVGVFSCAVITSFLLQTSFAAEQGVAASKVVSMQRTLAAQPDALPGQAVTQLADGRWLMSGGKGAQKTLAVIDPTTGRSATLPYSLIQSRIGHSATLLPDGTIFVFGGTDESGSVVNTGEIVDLHAGAPRTLGTLGLISRSGHTATLLADGTVLLVGGRDARGVGVADAELFDPMSQTASHINTRLDPVRWDQVAALLPTAGVLLVGGKNASLSDIQTAQALDPIAQTINAVDDASAAALVNSILGTTAPSVVATSPAASSTNFPVNNRIVVRLSKRMNVATLSAQTVTLVGPNGPVSTTVVGAERGLLLFVSPKQDLLPATHYSLFVKGATDELGQPLPVVAVGFSTGSIAAANAHAKSGTAGVGAPVADAGSSNQLAAAPVAAVASQGQVASEAAVADAELGVEEWTPENRHQHGNWRTGRHKSRFQSLPPLQAAGGVTALAGQVLRLNGKPLADVELRSSGKTTRTDVTGRFILENLPAGPVVLEINGATADGGAVDYGYFSDRVVLKAGTTTPLGYPIWMTRLDTKHVVNIASPTTQETIVTNPSIPGLELHLPAGTVIKDRQGKIVTQLSITAIPTDRPPFPLPAGVNVPTYFTVQPGGSTIENLNSRTPVGARLIYPNFTNQPPGSTVLFWDYDPQAKGWYVYGKGKVSVDGKQSIPNPGVAIYQLTGAMVGSPDMGPPLNPPPCEDESCDGPDPTPNPDPPDPNQPDPNQPDPNNGSGDSGGSSCTGETAGDPVDCSTGIFMYRHRDLTIKDKVSIGITRTYLSRDGTQRGFGIGATHDYDMFMVGDTTPWTYQDLILPRGGRIHFTRTSSGTSYIDAVYVAQSTANSRFQGATLSWNTAVGDWILRTKDGSSYEFPEAENNTIPSFSGMLAFTDKNGNKVTIERNTPNNDVSRVVSPNGRFITFAYDDNYRVTQITDISGRIVQYQYDDLGRLSAVTDPNGGVERYTYDSNNNMLSVTDARGNLKIQNTYEPTYQGVATQTLADGGVYHFSYGFSSATATASSFPKHLTTDVTDPNGVLSRRTFDTNQNATTNVAGMNGDYVLRFDQAIGTSLQWSRTAVRDAAGRMTSFTDEIGRTTTKSYDAYGNLVSQTRLSGTPQAATTTYAYDGKNRLVTKTDALGHTTSYGYDSSGNVISRTDALGHVWLKTYDSQGNLITQKDPLSGMKSYVFSSGLLSQVTDEIGSGTRLNRDLLGRVTSIVDALGNTRNYGYDALDRVTKVTDATGQNLSKQFDANGNVRQITTPAGLIYAYTYDTRNRPTSEIDPAGKSTTWSYDATGKLLKMVDRKGQSTSMIYNGLGQLTARNYADGVSDALTWDAANRLLSVTRGGDTYSFVHDGLDNVVLEQGPAGSVSSTYDIVGRRTILMPDAQPTVTYSYDNANRLSVMSQAAGSSNGNVPQNVAYVWDIANRLIGRTLPNAIGENRVLNASGDVLQIGFSSTAQSIGTIIYTYDATHRRVSVNNTVSPPILPASASFQYDAAGHLINFNGGQLTYDANGSMTSDSSYSYVWDSRGALSQLNTISGQSVASFSYDPLKRRSIVMLPTDPSPRAFLYDGFNIVQETVYMQTNDSGKSTIATYLNGKSIDEVIARYSTQGSETMIVDGQRSVIALSDTSGALRTLYQYDPNGVGTSTGNTSANHVQYASRENDNTGLYFYRSRYYHPALGRFISADPIGFASGQLSSYAYLNGSPLSGRDPLGLMFSPNGSDSYGPGDPSPNDGTGGGGICPSDNGGSSQYAGSPKTGEPQSWEQYGTTDRYYGPDGNAAYDIDSHPDHGAGTPHLHNWVDGVRGPGISLPPGTFGR